MIVTPTPDHTQTDRCRPCALLPRHCDTHGGFFEDDCDHAGTDVEERIGGILFGYCARCQKPVQNTGPEDEQGIPGWEVCE
jgi:hypothetical protein